MPAITLKNIPDNLYNKIKESALRNYRSINSEIIFRLERQLSPAQINATEFLQKIETINKHLKLPKLTDSFLSEAKDEGRK
jgi:antitoxin FitA